MKKIGKFFKEELLFIIVFILYSVSLITYFCISGKNFSVLYCILLGVFFFILYLIIAFANYYSFKGDLKRLSMSEINERSFSPLKNDTTAVINEIHNRYNKKINELEAKNVEDKRFVSAWIHNLKTPIAVNDLLIQRVKNGEIEADYAIDSIRMENDKLLSMLNAILDLERLDEFSKDFYPTKINLTEELRTIINDNKRLFISSKVFPKLEADMDYYVLSDSKWNRVLINQIISNAVKYSNGATEIILKLKQEDDKTILSINDFGMGIKEYDLPKIFEPFFTGENGRTGVNSSGIGLYLCKEICKHLNHTIEVSSVVDKGTIVTITYLTKM